MDDELLLISTVLVVVVVGLLALANPLAALAPGLIWIGVVWLLRKRHDH